MSHWVVFLLTEVDKVLEQAWEHRETEKQAWVTKTADEIEKLGNLNSSNGGFILVHENPVVENGAEKFDALLLPRSIDWEIHMRLKGHAGFQTLLGQNNTRIKEIQEDILFTLRSKLIAESRQIIDAYVAKGAPPPSPED